MNKSYVLLRMYDSFCRGEGVVLNECCNACGISVATFRRYISFLREYFAEVNGDEIVYDSALSKYVLKHGGL